MKRLMVALLLLIASTAWGEDETPVTWYGSYDCGEWFNPQYRNASRQWLLGYLSGLNISWHRQFPQSNPLSRLSSADAAFLWMDNYCRANPLEKVVWAGSQLFDELILRQMTNK